ncbi:exodeoxyribonuclease VII large subunit [Haliea sp. E1-2-M8]|uniref:exodeoxyribonuclease VII large subunit n=1 Tax=Haliea sp. E1-2-M8 TaxID=3064706 RepID=UPI00271839BA|nr:exodeoxyribonuclease VII large subunit [Haliea sp. E1-2-M8]MDO8862049.1 exodeoxyribonuclease VII large subunit [Haliea sp. E1-2-M8]
MQRPVSDTPPTLTVGQLNREARRLLESHFDFLWVEGEISNFAAPSSGHWYFTLKDSAAQVRCAMFRNRNQHMRVTPENGMAIRLRCRVSLYEGRGEFQLIVEYLEHAGAGALQAAFERLRDKLQAEGLFAAARKRPLPAQVDRLGVITSPTGAAIHDVLTVLRRRCPAMEVLLLPVPVQGETAAGEIRAAIERANRWQAQGLVQLDALLVTRGGGSLEDLWAFNEEIVARAIVASSLPVVSAVGHEIDLSIADMVADQRAATPSAAAELLSPDQREWSARLAQLEQNLASRIQIRLRQAKRELLHLGERLRHPGHLLREQAQRLDDLEQRLRRAQRTLLRDQRSRLLLLESRLQARSPETRLRNLQEQVARLEQRQQRGMGSKLQDAATRLAHMAQLLDSVSPLATLNRGYSILTDGAGQVVRDAEEVNPGDLLDARLARGRLRLEVKQR